VSVGLGKAAELTLAALFMEGVGGGVDDGWVANIYILSA
jgi:hypothetical protein